MALVADDVVVMIRARSEQLERGMATAANVSEAAMSRVERSANRAEAAVRVAGNRMGTALQQGARGSQMLGAQIADIGTQLAAGTSPFLVLAQQGNQVAMAMAGTTTAVGRFASFLTGPLGAALLAGVSFIGLFASKMLEAEDATQKKKTAIERLKEALQQYQEANGKAAQSETVAIRLTELSTKAILEKEIATRKLIKAQLEQVKAQLAADKADTRSPDINRQFRIQRAERAIPNIDARIAEQDQRIGEARAQAAVAAGQSALLRVAAATDRVAKATQDYDLRLFSLNRKLARGAISVEEFEREALAATRARDAAMNAAQASSRRGRGTSDDAAARRAEAARVREVREDVAFGRELGGTRAEYLSVLSELTADTRLQDEYLREQIRIEQAARSRDYDLRSSAGDISAAEAAQLKALNDQIAAARLDLVNRNESIRAEREEAQARQAEAQNRRDLLNAQGSLAETAAERQQIERRLLDLQFEEERARMDAIAKSKSASEAEKQIAAARLALLPQLRAAAEEGIARRYEAPGQGYRRSLQRDADEINRNIEAISVRGLESLNDGLVDAIMGVRSLGDVFKNVANQIIADLLRIAVQRAVIEPLAGAAFSALGGGFDFAGAQSGFRSSVRQLDGILAGERQGLFGRASGGFVQAGQLYRVNEGAGAGRVEGFRPAGSGTIVPLGQMNAARRGGTGEPVVIRITADEGAMFVPRVQQISGEVSVQVVEQRTPRIAATVSAEAMRRATRRTL